MHQRPTKSQTRPKISTMPRQQSEAATFLDIYKLVIEKKRLELELQGIEQRRQQIVDRLSLLESQVSSLENKAHSFRRSDHSSLPPTQPPPARQLESSLAGETLDTLFLEY